MIHSIFSTTSNPYISTNPLSGMPSGTPIRSPESTLDAVVVDVVVNEDHPEFLLDGYNVGAIRVRFLKFDIHKDDADLSWAFPIDTTLEEYPLKNEIVIVEEHLNRLYYRTKINVGRSANNQSYTGVQSEMVSDDTIGSRDTSAFSPQKPTIDLKNKLGVYFLEGFVPRRRHWEGDVILQGRFGGSIRFGSSRLAPKVSKDQFVATNVDQSPNLLISVGTSVDNTSPLTEFGRTVEDINLDATSLWMTTDQVVKIKLATEGSAIHRKSISNYPVVLGGPQIIFNSDRIVLNAKTDRIMGFAGYGINWTTLADFTVDAGQDYISTIGRDLGITVGKDYISYIGNDRADRIEKDLKLSIGRDFQATIVGNYITQVGKNMGLYSQNSIAIDSNRIFIGTTANESQPLVLGADLAAFLANLVDLFIQTASTHVLTAVGPGVLNAGLVSQLTALKAQLTADSGKAASFNSTKAFIGKT